jgi:para-aminobenzoate synthetase component 2
MHGQQVEIIVPDWFDFLPRDLLGTKVRVQRYNSLCVKPEKEKMPTGTKFLVDQNELMAASFANTLTYQFHPESVGTSFRQSFFRPLLDFFV